MMTPTSAATHHGRRRPWVPAWRRYGQLLVLGLGTGCGSSSPAGSAASDDVTATQGSDGAAAAGTTGSATEASSGAQTGASQTGGQDTTADASTGTAPGTTTAAGAHDDLLFFDGFDYASGTFTDNGWSYAGDFDGNTRVKHLAADPGCYSDDTCARIEYQYSGTPNYQLQYKLIDHPEITDQFYIRFYFKRTDYNGEPTGSKFIKIFGVKEAPAGYANTTMAITGTGGVIKEVSYGSGVGVENDTQATIRFDGQTTDPDVNVLASKGGSITGFDDTWTCFEAFYKFNANDLRDGEYRVWVDDELVLDAVNVKNRNNDNGPIDRVSFGDYTPGEASWNLWFDDVAIADHPIGCDP